MMDSIDGGPLSTTSDAALLRSLLDDQAARWQRGERVLVETYLARQTALQTATKAVMDLILNEALLRRQCGETLQLQEYLERFPQWADQLRSRFEVERLIEGESQLPTVLQQSISLWGT